MLDKLHIEVKYSALYRPQSVGLLERQHKSIKDSLKACLVEMGEKHQDRWLDHLPFVLLGRRVAYQPDLGASASEMVYGTNVRIPGQLLHDPGEPETGPELQDILQRVRLNDTRPTMQTSRHSAPENKLKEIPSNVTHVYTRQHQVTGLQSPFEGPFRIAERTSRSTVKIEVGLYRDGTKRYEIRHLNDCKLAHPDSLAAPASRPKLGRPPMSTSETVLKPNSETGEVGQDVRLPHPPNRSTGGQENIPAAKNKQALVGTNESDNHATSNSEQRGSAPSQEAGEGETRPSSILPQTTGAPPVAAFPERAARSTRNKNPRYIDAIWSASSAELALINRSIGD